MGCSHAIYTVKSVVDHFSRQGSTVNLCALDLRKAFDKMNHHGLFITLMKRMVPLNLLCTLEYWFSMCYTCVRWRSSFSNFFKINCGVRQGGVLSAYFFAMYIDDIITIVQRSKIGCCIGTLFVNIFLYADDIVLLAPSIDALQKLLTLCEQHLAYLDMALNAKKSTCIRFGRYFKDECRPITTSSGECLCWVSSCRYLGVMLIAAKYFKISISSNKKSFYKSFNSIYGKIGRRASEDVVTKLIVSKCLPVFTYGLDACPLLKSDLRSMDFVFIRALMRVFNTNSIEIINQCQLSFHLRKPSAIVSNLKLRFLQRYITTDNLHCSFFANTARREIFSHDSDIL